MELPVPMYVGVLILGAVFAWFTAGLYAAVNIDEEGLTHPVRMYEIGYTLTVLSGPFGLRRYRRLSADRSCGAAIARNLYREDLRRRMNRKNQELC